MGILKGISAYVCWFWGQTSKECFITSQTVIHSMTFALWLNHIIYRKHILKCSKNTALLYVSSGLADRGNCASDVVFRHVFSKMMHFYLMHPYERSNVMEYVMAHNLWVRKRDKKIILPKSVKSFSQNWALSYRIFIA